jgi:hypothetical protein
MITSKITAIALIAACVSPMAATAGGIAPELMEAPVTVVSDEPVVPLVGSMSPVATGAAVLVGLGLLAAVAGGGDDTSGTTASTTQ